MGADAKTMAKAVFVEKTGVIEVQKADSAKKEKYNTILLKVGEETFKLLPGKAPEIKKTFKGLNALGGKEVTVTGELKPANPPKYPLPAIIVETFKESSDAVPAPKKK
ncbi:MAG: hypothetical protein A3J70_03660 [Elusimicrobia bacterium RIFCSPHIGHO2_02_FULL_61_10]|nr:MAG: hypothetical protein A3J70_03660 [Elusimicrobia bacterium RIFCSPHIGHO2_02_FULL_61_10]